MSGLKINNEILHWEKWHAWLLPAAVFFFLPFEVLLYVPLVIMSLAGIILFLRTGGYETFRRNDKYKLLIYIFALIWLPMLFSLTDAVNTGHSVKTTLLLLPYFFVGIFMLFYLDAPEARDKLHLAILIITTFWCLYALIQLFSDVHLLDHTHLKSDRLRGIFYPKYTLGLVLAVLMPVVLDKLGKIANNPARLLIAIIIASMHVAVIVLSGSRNALIMLFIGLGGWFIYSIYIKRNIKWRRVILVSVIGVPIIAFLSFQQPTRVGTLLHMDVTDLRALDKISNHRLSLWEAAARMSLDHWINGIGPRGFRHAYNDYRPVVGKYDYEYKHGSTHPHFALLEITTETGLTGLIGILFLFFLLFKKTHDLADRVKLDVYPWFFGAAIAVIPNIAKAFYSSFWMSIVLSMIFIGIANINNPNGHLPGRH